MTDQPNDPMNLKEGVYYDVDIERYHNEEICVSHSVSSTGVRHALKCPFKYWGNSHLAPGREKTDTDALRFGKAIAFMMSDPDAFMAKVKVFVDFKITKEENRSELAREWREQGGLAIRQTEYDKMREMLAVASQDRNFRNAYGGEGNTEATLIYKDRETGLYVRARPDWLPISRQIIPDYKTTQDAEPDEFSRSIARYRYHVQAAILAEATKANFGHWPRVIYTPQEKEYPYAVSVVPLDDTAIAFGRMLLRKGLRTIADCLDRNVWPQYTSDEPKTVGLPAYELKKLEAMVERGELSPAHDAPSFEQDFEG